MAHNEIENIKKNEITVNQTYQAVLNNCFDLFKNYEVNFTPYQKECGIKALTFIDNLLKKECLSFDDPTVNFSSIKNVVSYCASYELNAEQKEARISLRNEKDKNGKWIKVVEVSPMIKGTLKIITKRGVDVKKVYRYWVIKEGDEYTPPKYKGIDITPPEWTQNSKSEKVIRVVVPIEDVYGHIEYYIAERESVAVNLKAQIQQSLLSLKNEDKQLAIRIYEKMRDMTLDQLLDDKDLSRFINKTYSGISREEMITTKLVGNAIKRIQINYNNEIERELVERTYDNANVYKPNQKLTEIEEKENHEVKDETPTVEVKHDENGVVEYDTNEYLFGNE